MREDAIKKTSALRIISQELQQIFAAAPPTVMLEADAPKFTFIYGNPAFYRTSGRKAEDIVGLGVFEVFPENPQDTQTGNVSAFRSSLMECIKTKKETHLPGQKYDIPIPGTDKFETRYWQASNNPILDAQTGEVDYIIHLSIDITGAFELAKQERIAFEVAEAQRRELQSLFMEAPAGIVVYDGPEFIFQLVNPVYQSFFPGRELLGKPMVEALPELRGHDVLEAFKHTYQTGETYFGKEVKTPLVREPNGPLVDSYWNFICQPRYNEKREIDGILMFGFEVTVQVEARLATQEVNEKLVAINDELAATNKELKQAQKGEQATNVRLEEAVESLGLALESAEMGTWKADLATDLLTVSERSSAIYGVPLGTVITLTQWAMLIELPYREKVLSHIEEIVKTGNKFSAEFVTNTFEGGSKKWIRSTGKAFYDSNGIPVYVFGTILDITAEKEQEEMLKYRKALLEAQNEAIPDAILIVDTKGSILSFNNNFIKLWKIPQDIIDRKDDTGALQFAMTQIQDPKSFIERVNYCYDHPNESAYDEVLFKDGRIIERVGTSVTDEDGASYGWAWYFRDITHQRQLQKQKDEFISTVSHELKTPVTSIKAYAQLLHRVLPDSLKTGEKGFLERMNTQVLRLEELILDLLDTTRVDIGKFRLKEDLFDLQELLNELISDLQLISPWHQLILVQNDSVTINTDKGRITQVITNLVTNAVKYSPLADSVRICSKITDRFLTFSVTDFGFGIPDHQKEFIFERFHQIERNNAGTGFNLGLGLYISKEIITKAGGKIWVESELGKGTTFYFTLPCYNNQVK